MNAAQPKILASPENLIAKCHVRVGMSFLLFFVGATFTKAQQNPGQAQALTQPQEQSSKVPANVSSQITESVNDAQRTLLRGNTHPLALPEFDRGGVASSTPMKRMLLVLKRSAEQEGALAKLLEEQQEESSTNYHKWLTPEEFGRRFGPSDADIQTITGWLVSHGFQGARVGNGRTVVEFSGTVAEVEEAFHTQIHRFVVSGEERWANVSDPEIPAALAPAVRGLVSLHNFAKTPMSHRAEPYLRTETGEVLPLFSGTGSRGPFNAVGPSDFAKIYNVQPLWDAGMDGTGQTIAIVGESNINIQDVRDFRSFFGLPPNDPKITLSGPDPGLRRGSEVEANLDVQWAGAVARNAKIEYVIAENTLTTAGIDLAAVYIIDNNIAGILSESFGLCEASLGTAGNAFYNALWQQAAAQGITVLVSSGDGGAAGCDNFNAPAPAHLGLAVSGLASTPYNIAVGGTDFDHVGREATFWDTGNNPITRASAKSYIPEIPWNDSCAAGAGAGCPNIVAGSGGPSSVYRQKPPWQTGLGVPADGVRDVPDVSLFASDGRLSNSFYVVCEADLIPPGGPPSCNASSGSTSFLRVGGTSASAPAFAGIMALVNQKTGTRQGNANFTLYKLAAQPGKRCDASDPATVTNAACIFYDVTKGNISVPCASGSPNCGSSLVLADPSNPALPAWAAHAGYDLTTGLGTVNAFNLVNNWSSVVFTASATTLALAPVQITHGDGTNVTVMVTGTPGTPTGKIALIGGPSGATLGIDGATLVNGTASFTTKLLPGGAAYSVRAHYDGDGTFGASDSSPVTVTVSPEDSQTQLDFVTFDPTTGRPTHNATAAVYGSPYILRVNVVSKTTPIACLPNPIGESACPTGTVLLTDNGAALDGGTFGLNSGGFLEDQPIQLPAGTHGLSGTYSGDNSFNTSSASATVTISKAATTSTLSATPTTIGAGANVSLIVTIHTNSNAVANVQQMPTGTVQFQDNGTNLSGPIFVSGGIDSRGMAQATVNASIAFLVAGVHSITARYNGDNNYLESNTSATQVTVLAATTTTVTSSNPAATQSTKVTFTARVAPGSPVPTGTIQFAIDGVNIGGAVALANMQAELSVDSLPIGVHAIKATYSGDSNYGGSFGQISQTISAGPDFTLNSNPMLNGVTAGVSATYTISAMSQNGFTGSINLACTVQPPAGVVPPSPPTCNFSNASITPASTSILTVSTTSRAALPRVPVERRWPPVPSPWLIALAALVAALTCYFARRTSSGAKQQRTVASVTFAALVLLLIFEAVGCGGGGGSTPPPVPHGTTAGQYTVTVTGTASGLTPHSVAVTLNVN